MKGEEKKGKYSIWQSHILAIIHINSTFFFFRVKEPHTFKNLTLKPFFSH